MKATAIAKTFVRLQPYLPAIGIGALAVVAFILIRTGKLRSLLAGTATDAVTNVVGGLYDVGKNLVGQPLAEALDTTVYDWFWPVNPSPAMDTLRVWFLDGTNETMSSSEFWARGLCRTDYEAAKFGRPKTHQIVPASKRGLYNVRQIDYGFESWTIPVQWNVDDFLRKGR